MILKKKAQAFWEATNQHGMALKAGMASQICNLMDNHLVEVARSLITENRLRAVISKSPDLLQESRQMKLIGLLAKDVCEELDKCHAEELHALKQGLPQFRKTILILAKLFVEANASAIRADVG